MNPRPEFTGRECGRDDFDLLTALGSQAAAALLAARMAEELVPCPGTAGLEPSVGLCSPRYKKRGHHACCGKTPRSTSMSRSSRQLN